jgi:UDP-sulfoquinovose synthase
MKILILGGDGFCGWPTALHLSAQGHCVVIVDNLSRRNIDNELEVQSLTPIRPLGERIGTWYELTGREIQFVRMDVATEYDRLLELIRSHRPDAIVHFAEQRAAPYSMKSSWHKRYTVNNNLNATNNVLAAIVDSRQDIHLVHLGTMGVYGYSSVGVKLPEGYLNVKMTNDDGEEVEQEILYPANPGSIYHMTKTQDQLFFAFYNKNDQVRVTDLHQGIVWGTQTSETRLDERLINRFDYDGDYGTVLNRFLMQAAIDYPLTVHGVKILNQLTETHRLIDLARLVSEMTGVPIEHVPNPRREADANDLAASNEGLVGLGLQPTTLKGGLLEEVTDIARRYAERCDRTRIPCMSHWTTDIAGDIEVIVPSGEASTAG